VPVPRIEGERRQPWCTREDACLPPSSKNHEPYTTPSEVGAKCMNKPCDKSRSAPVHPVHCRARSAQGREREGAREAHLVRDGRAGVLPVREDRHVLPAARAAREEHGRERDDEVARRVRVPARAAAAPLGQPRAPGAGRTGAHRPST
jgi:hypothetical protein